MVSTARLSDARLMLIDRYQKRNLEQSSLAVHEAVICSKANEFINIQPELAPRVT